MARKKGRNTRSVNLSLNKDIIDLVGPYIDNLSQFVNTCLKNFYKKNKDIIDSDELKNSKLLVDSNLDSDDLPNITYIMNNLPVQLSLFPIVENRVLSKKKKIITYPCSGDLLFLSNNSLKLNDKIYYFEIIYNYKSNNLNSQVIDVFSDNDRWW